MSSTWRSRMSITTRSSSPGTIVDFDATAATGCIAPIRASSPAVASMLFWSATSAFGMPGVSTFVATGVTLQPASPQAMRTRGEKRRW